MDKAPQTPASAFDFQPAGHVRWECNQNQAILGHWLSVREDHQHGHYYAVFIYRGLSWIVDDGSYPRVLPQIQNTTKQQIVQVWAVPSENLLPGELQSDVIPRSTKFGAEASAPKRRKL